MANASHVPDKSANRTSEVMVRHLSGERVNLPLLAKGLTVVGFRLMGSVFGLLFLTTEPRTGGGATGSDGYVAVGIENLDC